MADKIFLGLGSNKGDRFFFINSAVEELNKNQCRIEKKSSIYETLPFGNKNQQNFYNAAVEISTTYTLLDLFKLIKEIEIKIGRNSTKEKWGSREIDIDILFYNQLIYKSDKLIIPHNGILERDFVLEPLIEIDENFVHPVYKKKLKDFDRSSIEKHIINKFNFSEGHLARS